MKLMMKLLTFLPVALLINCTPTGAVIENAGFSVVCISQDDQLSDETARVILANNLTGERNGYWSKDDC